MDPEGWYSATPEALAKHHAGRNSVHLPTVAIFINIQC